LDGGIDPVWRGDGKEIIYRNGSAIGFALARPKLSSTFALRQA
jgi:hypothetical protein